MLPTYTSQPEHNITTNLLSQPKTCYYVTIDSKHY